MNPDNKRNLRLLMMIMDASDQVKPLYGPTSNRPQFKDGSKIVRFNVLRDNFTLTTWLLIGAVLQSSAFLLVPHIYAIAPAILLLAWRCVDTILMTFGVIKNRQIEGVVMGKVSAQIPDLQGAFSTRVSNEEVTILLLATRSNQELMPPSPMGMFGPGFKEVSNYMQKMRVSLAENAETNGFLGQSTWLSANERATANQIMVSIYFRTPSDVHSFAHSPIHREAWHWWNSITKSHPHLSIMHELYHAPKGNWENVFINNHPTGIAATHAPVRAVSEKGQAKWIHPLFDASKGRMRTHTGRMGTGDGADNIEFDQDTYSSGTIY